MDIAHLQQLKNLSIETVYRGNELLALRELPNLCSVSLSWCFFEDIDADAVCEAVIDYVSTEDFDESGCWVGPQLSQLTSLTLSPCSNADAVLAALPPAAAASLEECVLMQANVNEESVPVLATFTSLQYLDLEDNMGVEDVRPLTALTRLTFLGLGSTCVEDPSLPAIAEMQQLKSLQLHTYQGINYSCLHVLSQLQNLQGLGLGLHVWELWEEVGDEEAEQMPEELAAVVEKLEAALPDTCIY